jgi:hypothetical protein
LSSDRSAGVAADAVGTQKSFGGQSGVLEGLTLVGNSLLFLDFFPQLFVELKQLIYFSV